MICLSWSQYVIIVFITNKTNIFNKITPEKETENTHLQRRYDVIIISDIAAKITYMVY